jgi:hypothetical protein
MINIKGEEVLFTIYPEKGSPPLEASRIVAYIPLLSEKGDWISGVGGYGFTRWCASGACYLAIKAFFG